MERRLIHMTYIYITINIKQRKLNIVWSQLHMESKEQTNKQTENKLIDTENILVVVQQ